MGGEGGGIARTETEYRERVAEGLAASPIGQVLVDESVIGWGEFELEVMRDRNDNVVVVCSIENVDPMGVHTGDSVTVAPQQTLSDRQYQALRDQAIAVIRAVGVETGGSNIQFAVNPETDEIVVIEMNPRVSRSSALASKATGFPIAKIAARLAVGYALEEIDNDITQVTPASFEPTIDYVVVKWPRFAFEKFPGADGSLSTYMQSVGEAMAIGRTFKQAFVKAMRSRELDVVAAGARGHRRAAARRSRPPRTTATSCCSRPCGAAWGRPSCARAPESTRGSWRRWPRSRAVEDPEAGLVRTFKAVDTCAAEFEAATPVLLLRLGAPGPDGPRHEVIRGDRPSVVILGSGPNRIGQGIEFDYCCVHAAMTVRASGRDAVMVNCNPETVSTDYDTSDRLYFEPLTLEDVLGVIELEQPGGRDRAVRRPDPAQARPAAWPTPACRCSARPSSRSTWPRTARASARSWRSWGSRARRTPRPPRPPRRWWPRSRWASRCWCARPTCSADGRWRSATPTTGCAAIWSAPTGRTGRPAPSSSTASWRTRSRSTWTRSATAQTVQIGAIMQHVEEAGVHSGDSACVIPAMSLGPEMLRQVEEATRRIALRLGVVGLINIQFAVFGDDELYVIEANPRASRTVPFVSKAIGVPLAKVACRLMLGERLADLDLDLPATPGHVSVKEAVLPFGRFPRADALLGPEMKSTGEVMGVAAGLPDRVRQGAGGRRGAAAHGAARSSSP